MAQRHPHIPPEAHRTPNNTYRLQLTPDFTFDQARAILPYLTQLGVTDIYLSPILQAVPGSQHGYDVVDHTHISRELGGRPAFEALARSAHSLGLGVVVDIVPNHMAVPTPVYLNQALWSVLKNGQDSAFAQWFDVDPSQPLLMPILGERIGQVLATEQLKLTQMEVPGQEAVGQQWVLTYFDHVFPVAEGTEALPLEVLLERQHYRLAYWKIGDEELNYRRFFDVDTLAGVRVEIPEVFDATHALLLDLFDLGFIDAFRVDHPDGLADPHGYFKRLSDRVSGAWIAAEKILEGDERLPADWPVAGTTGYDTSWRIQALQVNPNAAMPLGAIMQTLTGDSPSSWDHQVRQAKRDVIGHSLSAEVRRVADIIWDVCQDDLRLRDHTVSGLTQCLQELIIQMPQYRVYVNPGTPASQGARDVLEAARQRAMKYLEPDLTDTMDVLMALILGEEVGSAAKKDDPRRWEISVRFQQVCGAVMAKGVEDTAFYRWTHLVALTEVGGAAECFGIDMDSFHAFESFQQETWPVTMTCGTTHDSKRGEDVRARLCVLTDYTQEWVLLVEQLRFASSSFRPSTLDGRAENLLWQTLAATWGDEDPMTTDRLAQYLIKAVREQKTWTSWTAPDSTREEELIAFATRCLEEPDVTALLDRWWQQTSAVQRTCILVNKALQLTVPGVADVYQGSEVVRTSLVDPDNRRPVDFETLSHMLKEIDGGHIPTLSSEKLRLTRAILKLRAHMPDVFVSDQSGYTPLPTSSGHAIAFARSNADGPQVITVATRLPRPLMERGWGDQTVVLPEGDWVDVIYGRPFTGGTTLLADVFASDPVAILKRSQKAKA